jgi:hypothetical protein
LLVDEAPDELAAPAIPGSVEHPVGDGAGGASQGYPVAGTDGADELNQA